MYTIMSALALIIAVLAVATMIVVGSNGLKRWFGRQIMNIAKSLERFNEKWFSDDEPFDESWMDEEAWKRTRI